MKKKPKKKIVFYQYQIRLCFEAPKPPPLPEQDPLQKKLNFICRINRKFSEILNNRYQYENQKTIPAKD